jgi:hypothetical protein
MQANRTAAVAKQKAKREKDAAEAVASAAAAVAAPSTPKRKHVPAFDCSQQSTQYEPPESQEGPVEGTELKKFKGEAEQTQQGTKKRKNVTELIKGINIEVKKTKAAKTSEYQARLDSRTARPPTAAETRTSNEPATGVSGAGYDRIHPSHKRCSLNGEIIFCWNCGYWMKYKSQNLQQRCVAVGGGSTQLSHYQKDIRNNKPRKCLYPQKKEGKIAKWDDGTCTSKKVPIEWLDRL